MIKILSKLRLLLFKLWISFKSHMIPVRKKHSHDCNVCNLMYRHRTCYCHECDAGFCLYIMLSPSPWIMVISIRNFKKFLFSFYFICLFFIFSQFCQHKKSEETWECFGAVIWVQSARSTLPPSAHILDVWSDW